MATSGIGSTLDVNSIVSQLMAVEARPLTNLAKKEASYHARLSAYGSLSGALGNFQTALNGLSTPAKFQGVTASSGDSTIFSGSATVDAVAGSYDVNVKQLAQAQTVSTTGQLSPSTSIGDGKKTTLTFEFGAITGGKLSSGKYSSDPAATPPDPTFTQDAQQASKTVVIDQSNNSLQGIRDAINKASIGVIATIVSDGSDTPHHLVLTSEKTGEKSSMKISVARDPADPVDTALSDLLTFDPKGTQKLIQSSAAQDSKLSVNGIEVKGATRTIAGAIQGVSLTLTKVGTSTMTVSRDTGAVEGAVKQFVKAYNDLDKTIKSVASYNPTTKEAGLLLGDSTVRAVQNDVRKLMSSTLEGTGGALNNLTQIGITFAKDGTLAIDSSKLSGAVTKNFQDIASLFASFGSATDSMLSFDSSTNKTKPGSYLVNITAAATQGGLVSSAAPADLQIVTGANDQLSVSVDGKSATITLAANTYTNSSLIAQIQAAINGSPEFSSSGISVNVSADADGKLRVTSDRYGATSQVNIGGKGASNLFGTPIMTGGVDVAGTIGGMAAIGSGQTLSGQAGSKIDGLKLTVKGATTGARGTINFSQGFAFQLSAVADGYLGTKGLIASQTDGINSSIKELTKSKEAFSVKLTVTEKRLRAQFVALDTMLSNMGQTSNYLTQQLEQISNLSKQQ